MSIQNKKLHQENEALMSNNMILQSMVENLPIYNSPPMDTSVQFDDRQEAVEHQSVSQPVSDVETKNIEDESEFDNVIDFECPPRYINLEKDTLYIDATQKFDCQDCQEYQVKYFWNMHSKGIASDYTFENNKFDMKNIEEDVNDVKLKLRIAARVNRLDGAKFVKNCPINVHLYI